MGGEKIGGWGKCGFDKEYELLAMGVEGNLHKAARTL